MNNRIKIVLKMKKSVFLLMFLCVAISGFAQTNYLNESEEDFAKRMKWFTDARY